MAFEQQLKDISYSWGLLDLRLLFGSISWVIKSPLADGFGSSAPAAHFKIDYLGNLDQNILNKVEVPVQGLTCQLLIDRNYQKCKAAVRR